MLLEDLIILGRSSPDVMKDGRVSICAAGYSPTLGFVRLYPTRMDSPLKMWNIVSVPVERNRQDAREESWKIQGSKSEWDRLSDKIAVVGEVRREERLRLIRPLVSGCVLDICDQKKSLGMIKMTEKRCYFTKRDDFDPTLQMTLFGGTAISDKRRYRMQPRVEFRCSSCRSIGRHDQQILEWGVYEWMRKNPGREEQVWENLFWKEADQEILFLVGNQARRHSSYMVVSILRIPKPRGPRPRTRALSACVI